MPICPQDNSEFGVTLHCYAHVLQSSIKTCCAVIHMCSVAAVSPHAEKECTHVLLVKLFDVVTGQANA